MKNYRIYTNSNEHPRTINTPAMGRTYYTKIEVDTKEELILKLDTLIREGIVINEVRFGAGGSRVNWTKLIVGDIYTIKTKEGVRAFFAMDEFKAEVLCLRGKKVNFTTTHNGNIIHTCWMF